MEERISEGLGWRPDLPDYRDWRFSSTAEKTPATEQPPKHMVKNILKQPVIDQGRLGSCVGCSVGLMHSHVRKVAPRSKLQIYYEARRLISETHIDEGCYIRDAVKVISTLGAGREVWWPYEESKVFVDPLPTVDRDGLKRRIFKYTRLMGREDFRTCLLQNAPFVIGMSLYNGFISRAVAGSGIVDMPVSGEYAIGGHAITVIGYDDEFRQSEWAKRLVTMGWNLAKIPNRVYICRNSWGVDWGSNGNFAVNADYLEHYGLAGDAWTVRKS